MRISIQTHSEKICRILPRTEPAPVYFTGLRGDLAPAGLAS